VVEIAGTTAKSVSQPINDVGTKASTLLHQPDLFEVAEVRGAIANGKVPRYQGC
jgi:flavin-binding protein dodecin